MIIVDHITIPISSLAHNLLAILAIFLSTSFRLWSPIYLSLIHISLIIVRALTHYRRLTIYSCKLTGYNVFYHNPALGFLFSSQRSLSLSRQLLYSSNSRITCQHFFEVFFTSWCWLLLPKQLIYNIISHLSCQ